jgi:MFS transporter, DHA2 family, multidrug resistance protein
LGQTIGASLVSLFMARFALDGTRIALFAGVGFAIVGAVVSTLRLSEACARGAEYVRVKEDQRMKGE